MVEDRTRPLSVAVGQPQPQPLKALARPSLKLMVAPLWFSGKSQRVEMQRVKTSENFAEKTCSQNMFQKIFQKREDITSANLAVWFAVSVLIELSSNIQHKPMNTSWDAFAGNQASLRRMWFTLTGRCVALPCTPPPPSEQNRDCPTLGSQLSRISISV